MRFINREFLTYDDVLLVPQYSEIASRHEVDISSGKLGLKVPFISSNMDTVTEENMAIAMHNAGGLGIIHRFLSPQRLDEIIVRCKAAGAKPAVSIGINNDSKELVELAIKHKVQIYCIDVAHGHHAGVLRAIEKLRGLTSSIENVTIVAGNVATIEGAVALIRAGADVIKIGIGPGSHCTTRVVTGHGVPQLSALQECCPVIREHGCESIADGGIRNSGDIAKALATGADYVMLGRILAGCDEAPGYRTAINGRQVKTYRGMASREAQTSKGRDGSRIIAEGVASYIDYSGPVGDTVSRLVGGVKSAFSYTGARNIQEFRDKSTFVRITRNSYIEGTPHGAK